MRWKVHVHDFLACGRAVVLQHVEAFTTRGLLNRTNQTRKHTAQGRRRIVGQVAQFSGRLLGNHKAMAVGDRANIKKGQNVVVFIKTMARDFTGDDLGEKGGHGGEFVNSN